MRNSDDNNTVGLLRREPQNIGKVEVKRYQTSLLCAADFIKMLICRALQILVPDGQDVMSLRSEHLLRPRPEIFIQLELHPAATSTKRSRDISAP